MELAKLIEERVHLLLEEVRRLRDENTSLREELRAALAAADAGQKAYRDLNELRRSNEETARRLQDLADRIQNSLQSM